MSTPGWRSQSARIEPVFALISIVLHAALIYAISREPWLTRAPSARTVPPVVWLESAPAPPIVEEIAPQPRPELEETRVAAPPQIDAPEPDTSTEPRPPDAPRDPSSEPVPRARLEIDDAPPSLTPDFDFEAAREEAVALIIEEQRREAEYRTFSLDDLIEAPPPEEPGADRDVFAEAAEASRGRGLMRPSRARTRLGRAISQICNDLTGGGIGVFGLFSLCAEDGPRADLFGHLRPAYMEMLPVCTEQELTDAQLAAAQITDPSTIERTVVKCRLVDRDEVLVVPEP